MIKKLASADILLPLLEKERFDLDTKTTLMPYFDIHYLESSHEENLQFFENLMISARTNTGLTHCIHHDLVSRLMIAQGNSQEAKENVLSKKYNEITGGWTGIKRADEFTLEGLTLTGTKKWITNLHNASYVGLQIIDSDGISKCVYVDLTKTEHEIDFSNFKPLGMELAIPGSLKLNNVQIKPDHVLGLNDGIQFFRKNNFHGYCFLTNYLGITKELFLELKRYNENFSCGAELEIKKLESEVCSLQMQWEDNLASLKQQTSTDGFWHRRNTQYSFSKKTLIHVIQLILEVGVSYWTNAEGRYSQRFRDALTYSAHMYPLYLFNQKFHMVNLENNKG
jgi:hypothetical protein